MPERIHVGISTCPNDTFAFHGLMNREVDCRGFEFDVELIDISDEGPGVAAEELPGIVFVSDDIFGPKYEWPGQTRPGTAHWREGLCRVITTSVSFWLLIVV